MKSIQPTKQVDYGQDAPGVRLGMFAIGFVGFLLLIAEFIASRQSQQFSGAAGIAMLIAGTLLSLYGIGMGTYMTWSSRVGKLLSRDRLISQIDEKRPWCGDEMVLDVGCGRGLMLIGAAHKLSNGTAIGIDLWREEDQADNSPEATLHNARREGVVDRVRIETGDARKLPFENASMDVVLTHWVVHNLEDSADRKLIITEMWRVLRPGGVLAIADIGYVADYAEQLKAFGANSVEFYDGGIEAKIMGTLSGGTYRPQTLVCSRPMTSK
ncbi:arsenite methyltransferase [Undibacterium sp. GrIS 1.8]|uniref:class I SAM-dependent methyltransferase n=1 Tax=Undibacterium sp. GrIS 1.8 TaxID=3143934 RepID=UPI0033925E69